MYSMVQAVAGQENTDPNAEHASKPGKRRSQQRNKVLAVSQHGVRDGSGAKPADTACRLTVAVSAQKAAKRSLLEPASEHSLTGSEASTVTCLQEGQRPTSRAAR